MKNIRLANLQDASQILDIYRPYILETGISFEMEPPPKSEMESRISETLQKFPWLVFENDGQVLGYAYAGPHKSRCAYAWSVEVSVYVKQGHHGKGIGKALYADLFERLRAQGVINVIGGIALPNEASVKLHETFGFEPVARFKDIGFKMGQWWDVGYWQLQLQKPAKPGPLKSMEIGI